MENQRTNNVFDNSSTNPVIVIQPTVPPQTKTNLMMRILVTILLSGAVFGFGGYCLGKQSSLPKPPTLQSKTEVSPSPTSQSIENTSDLATFTGTVLPVTFQHSSKLKVYEGTKTDQGFGVGIHVAYDYPDNPSRFLHIDRTLPTNFEDLKRLKVGDKYQDKTITEEDITATRLEDRAIGGKSALVYEWNKLWEIPGPVRDYFIPYQNNYLRIRATYSNTLPSSDGNPMYTFDYVSAFDQILSTFKFTN